MAYHHINHHLYSLYRPNNTLSFSIQPSEVQKQATESCVWLRHILCHRHECSPQRTNAFSELFKIYTFLPTSMPPFLLSKLPRHNRMNIWVRLYYLKFSAGPKTVGGSKRHATIEHLFPLPLELHFGYCCSDLQRRTQVSHRSVLRSSGILNPTTY